MRWRVHLLLGLLAAFLFATAAPAPVAALQEASIAIDFDTGEVLHARNADERAYPASLTKMMTLYLTFEAIEAGRLSLASRLKVSSRAAAMPPTKLGLKPGSTIRVEDAILGLVTKSANDAASVIGENLGGSEERFARLMTQTARKLGMTRTTFRNASGLPDPEQRTTARDLAQLATRLITDYPQYYRYFSRKSFSYNGRTHGNHNRLLSSYRGMDGLKTGFIRASGFNLAASAVRDGQRVVAVVLGGSTARTRDKTMVELLNASFTKAARLRSAPPALVAERTPTPEQPVLAELAPASGDAAGSVETATDAVAVGQAEAETDVADAAEMAPAEEMAAPEVTLAAVRREEASVPAERPKRKPSAGAKTTSVKAGKAELRNAKRRGALPYGVQVGAYHRQAQAKEAAQQALRSAPSVLSGTFVSVSRQQTRKRTVFRAVLIGLSKDDADAACRLLKKKKQGCLVVRAEPVDLAAK